ncbi:uncharacterized protein LOC133872346 [Alnus glutinosa]|uniref:uncharacterized protein LOC133872346 n=1 Tax=Alnus glutinosa TaxID=3517 RepID=UPI002D769828|nr:uncharacterized protein LOC133872346 [Alnus glutinosa]
MRESSIFTASHLSPKKQMKKTTPNRTVRASFSPGLFVFGSNGSAARSSSNALISVSGMGDFGKKKNILQLQMRSHIVLNARGLPHHCCHMHKAAHSSLVLLHQCR